MSLFLDVFFDSANTCSASAMLNGSRTLMYTDVMPDGFRPGLVVI
jgi:hypothetical protein